MIITSIFFFLLHFPLSAMGDFVGCGFPTGGGQSSAPNLPGPSCWTLPKYSTEDQAALAQRRKEYLGRENLAPKEILARFLFAEAFQAQAYQSPDFPLVLEIIGISLLNRINLLKKFPLASQWYGEITLPEENSDQQAHNLLQIIFMPAAYQTSTGDSPAAQYFLCPLINDIALTRPILEYYQQAEQIAEKLLNGMATAVPLASAWEKKSKISLATDVFFPKIAPKPLDVAPEKIVTLEIDKRSPPNDYVILLRNNHENDLK